MDKNKIEYRLEYPDSKFIEVQYFDTLNDVYNYITTNRLTTFLIVKEELIASRMDTFYAESKD